MLNVNIKVSLANFTAHYHFNAGNEITGIFGASGHGKTTLLNAIAGLVKPGWGEITLNNKVLYSKKQKIGMPVKNRKVAYVFQDYKLFPHYTMLKNLQYGIPKGMDKYRAFEVARFLGIEHLLNKKPKHCSGGEKQRVAIGRALLSEPEVLLMDEPFAALDAERKEELIQYIRSVSRHFSIPIIIVSHDFQEMLKLVDKAIYIENGRITYHGDIFQALMTNDFASNEKMFKQYQNIVKLKVEGARIAPEKTLYETVNRATGMRFLIDALTPLNEGDEVRAILAPEDIVMATRPVYEISTSNQVPGTVLRIISAPYMVKCVVDIGFLVLVTITINAFERLGFSLGDKVWLQFKTTKINVAANHYQPLDKMQIA